MVYDIQKAGLWKRIAAWMFDSILTGILAVGIAMLLSMLLGYDAYNQSVDAAYAKYEQEYGIVFEITQEEYQALAEDQRQRYQEAYDALTRDEQAMQDYRMMLNLTLVIATAGILLAMLVWEFLIPLRLGNGQTLGKKIFGLCLVRQDGVMVNPMQLFTRTILGKYTIETMLPLYLLILSFWGVMGLTGTLVLFALAAAQVACIALSRQHSVIHDLLAGTVAADITSQMIFRTTEDLIAYKKKIAAEHAARQIY